MEQHCWSSAELVMVTDGGPDLLEDGLGIKTVPGPFMLTSPVLTPVGERPKRFHNSYWQCEASTRILSLTNEPRDRALYNRLRRKLIVRPGDDELAATASESRTFFRPSAPSDATSALRSAKVASSLEL